LEDVKKPCESRKLTKEAQNDPTLAKPVAQVEAPKEHKT